MCWEEGDVSSEWKFAPLSLRSHALFLSTAETVTHQTDLIGWMGGWLTQFCTHFLTTKGLNLQVCGNGSVTISNLN